MKQNELYNHTEEKGRKLSILRSQKNNGGLFILSQVLLPTLLYSLLCSSKNKDASNGTLI